MNENETWMRYSGNVTIAVTLTPLDVYVCTVADDSTESKQEVGHPRALRHALDSDEAIDEAARAAISFALHDNPAAFPGVVFNEGLGGIYIARKEEDRYGTR